MPNGPELIIVLVIVLLLFGGTQLPKLARSLGQAKREFERGGDDDRQEAGEATETRRRDEPSA